MDSIATESQLFVLHMNLVHLSRLFSERSLNLSDTVKVDSGTLENSPIEIDTWESLKKGFTKIIYFSYDCVNKITVLMVTSDFFCLFAHVIKVTAVPTWLNVQCGSALSFIL